MVEIADAAWILALIAVSVILGGAAGRKDWGTVLLAAAAWLAVLVWRMEDNRVTKPCTKPSAALQGEKG